MATQTMSLYTPGYVPATNYAYGYPQTNDSSYPYGYNYHPPTSQAQSLSGGKDRSRWSARTYTHQPPTSVTRSHRHHRDGKQSTVVSVDSQSMAFGHQSPPSNRPQALLPPSSARSVTSIRSGGPDVMYRKPGYVANMPPLDYFISGDSRRHAIELALRGVRRGSHQERRQILGPRHGVADRSGESVISRGRQRTREHERLPPDARSLYAVPDDYDDYYADSGSLMDPSDLGPEDSISQVSGQTIRSRRSHRKKENQAALAVNRGTRREREEMLLLDQWWGEDEQPYYDQGNGYWLRNVRPGYIVPAR